MHHEPWMLNSRKNKWKHFVPGPYTCYKLGSYPGGQEALESVIQDYMVLVIWHLIDTSVSRPVIDSVCCYRLSIFMIHLYGDPLQKAAFSSLFTMSNARNEMLVCSLQKVSNKSTTGVHKTYTLTVWNTVSITQYHQPFKIYVDQVHLLKAHNIISSFILIIRTKHHGT